MFGPQRLLTTQEVANLLQLSPRTVYKKRAALGGFYPAGIKALRFPWRMIYGLLEGERQGLEVSVPVRGQGIQRHPGPGNGDLVLDQGQGQGRRGGAEKRSHREEARKRDRFNLWGPGKLIPRICRTPLCRKNLEI